MVSASKGESVAVYSPAVRQTIRRIKEIVGNHSDAEIYVLLKESNMDPNETTQKLLNQDPFHEVKRKRDRKKENSGHNSFVVAEPRKNAEVVRTPPPPPVKHTTYSNHNARKSGFHTNSASDGASQKFRVVRDNRVNQNAGSNSTSERPVESNTSGSFGRQKSPVGQHSSQVLSGPTASRPDQTKDAFDKSAFLREKNLPATSRMHLKTNDPNTQSTTSSISSVVGVYSSASDPVHVPSLHPRPAANVGAIRREVGPRRKSSENTAKSSPQSVSVPNSQLAQEVNTKDSTKQSSVSKVDQPSQNVTTVSSVPGMTTIRSFSSNQHGGRGHQPNQKAPQPSKEWKRKSSPKASVNGPGIIGSPAKPVSPPAENSHGLQKEVVQMGDAMSQLNISENHNVIIASHIRVSETDRGRLTFGTLGTELSPPTNSVFLTNGISFGTLGTDDLSTKPSGSVSVSVPECSGEETTATKQLEMADESVRSSESDSPASGAAGPNLPEESESLAPRNLDNYADVRLVRDDGPSYTPETLPQQDTSELRSFSQGYEPQMGYDVSYFRPMVDDTVRGTGLPSSQEQMMGPHTTNTIPASIAMVQHQQQQLAQMYHYANIMPYRQYISPVYVPPMPVPGYSNSPAAYPHPSNGSSYVLMPGNSSHLTPQGLKYGIQQFKPVSTGGQTGFSNFSGPTGYAVNAPGVVGNAPGHEDSSRIKYKDSLYVPNPQAETSEMWMNPRDIPGLQSAASYYNMSGQTPHAYLPSHSGHTSYNPAAAAQSSHMQFGPGMYHPSNQPTAIPSPHHMGPGNVGVGVAGPTPGAQVGAYQQPQLGHVNWAGNF